ncbi:MAG: RNA 2',3'-cyclic phosphodiesterase [Ornithinibacter sp.]
MRLFVALTPPEDVVEHLDAFLDPRRDTPAPLRWSPPEQWHVTLAFMPSVPDHVVDDLVAGLEVLATHHSPDEISVGGGGCFPDVTRARVVWAGIRGGSSLASLARGARSAAANIGAAPEGGAFVPHLTLARLGRPTDATRWVRVLDAYAGPAWLVDEVALVESHLPREKAHRPRHQVLARLPLLGQEASPALRR